MNYRTLFMNETAQIYAKAVSSQVTVLQITFEALKSLITESDLYERKLMSHELKILNISKTYPLDYIRQWHADFMTAN